MSERPDVPLADLDDVDGVGRNDVELEALFDGAEGLRVQDVSIIDAVNTLPICTVRLAGRGGLPTTRELLRKNCVVEIRRPGYERHFRGIIWEARAYEEQEGFSLVLEIATAAHLLTQIVDSYIYHEKNVPEIVKAIYERYLAPSDRRVELAALQRTYADREYTVQYQESVYDFIARLCEDEGIFFFFDHDAEGEDHELLVLAEGPHGLPKARAHDNGSVAYNGYAEAPAGEEVVSHVEHSEQVGATDIVVSGYDWTQPGLRVHAARTGRGPSGPALEVHEHARGALTHGYQQPQYTGNTASVQADLGAERLDVARQTWRLRTTVLTAQAGYLLTLTNAPERELGVQYLIVAARCEGRIVTGGLGVWEATLAAVPTSIPYRPRRRPHPVAHGPETAVVVGPSGEDIHTDPHGRVKVQFHWDRQHQRNDESSCWLRVAHNWAGAGFGSFFLPRVGMEVLVSFLGGNPDRPLVTGCVYNGDNHVPQLKLPKEKTQTVIRTNSTGPAGPGAGYNELRFEDLSGAEYISWHAQRDLREKVLRNRTTSIGNDDRLTVTRNSYTRVHAEEEHIVDKAALWQYPTKIHYDLNRRETTVGAEAGEGPPGDYYSNCAERITIFGPSDGGAYEWQDVSNQTGRVTTFTGTNSWSINLESGFHLIACSNDPDTWVQVDAGAGVVDAAASTQLTINAGSMGSSSDIQLKPDKIAMKSPGEIKAEMTSGAASIEMSDSGIRLKVGAAELFLHAGGLTIDAPIFLQSGIVTTLSPSAALAVLAGVVTRGGNPMWD